MRVPPEIVEQVREGYAAFSRGDIDAALADLPADMRWDLSDRVFNPAVLEGHDAYRRDYEAMREQWEQVEFTVEEVLAGDDRIVVLTHDRFRGRGSGIEVDRRSANVWTLRDGVPASMRLYYDRAQALREAGIDR